MENKACFLKGFLEDCKDKLKSSDMTLCMGNEACDPDSFVSAISVALHENCVVVVNMNRRVFEAKGDVMLICKMFGIDLNDLVFMERPKGKLALNDRILGTSLRVGKDEYKLREKNVKLIIVDHHMPVEELRDLEIDLIIDHHSIGGVPLFARRIYVDADAGSCCTLVSKFIGHSLTSKREGKNKLFEDKGFRKSVSKMLSIPIAFDTKNFGSSTSHFDRGEFRKLVRNAGMCADEVESIARQMKSENKNDSDLESEMVLLKDFKRFDCGEMAFGYSTVKYAFEDWVDREARKIKADTEARSGMYLEMALSEFRREHGLDFLLVGRKSKNKRYLICVNCPVEKALVETSKSKATSYKGLHYYETDPLNSRKILAPIVQKLLYELRIDGNYQ